MRLPSRRRYPHSAADRLRRLLAVGVTGLLLCAGTEGTAYAVPPPPPNPSDSDVEASQNQANAQAGAVGQLTNQLAEAEAKLGELQNDVELKMEQANKALVDMQAAQDAASQAQQDASAARGESDAAAGAVETARANMNKFVTGSYQQGSTIGSVSAYVGSPNPENLLARAQLLEAVSDSQFNALKGLEQAQVDKSNKDSSARKALEVATAKQAEAEQSKSNADAAQSAAEQAQASQSSETERLTADKSSAQQQLYAAQSQVSGLNGQRQQYEQWQEQKAAEEEQQARQAAESVADSSQAAGANNGKGSSKGTGSQGSTKPRPSTPQAGSSVEAVISRAKSQLGLPYAWGGGNASGPTRGIRDGGVADRYGDYRKTGFDCSGLMIYAFAGVKSLTHYSGYQYTAGQRVPISQMRRGDMLFWGGGAGIHHVALYLGDGQMIEAPQSGSSVKISPVRYGGIMPYASRLIS